MENLLYVVLALSISLLIAVIYTIRLLKQQTTKDNTALAPSLPSNDKPSERAVKNQVILNTLRATPFNESLEPEKIKATISNELLQSLNNSKGEFARQGLQIAKVYTERHDIIAKFPKHAQKAISKGNAAVVQLKDGSLIPVARDLKSGQFIAHAKNFGPRAINTATSAAAVIVGLAHVISGQDNMKKLKKISKGVDQILVNRHNDMYSELEAIYESMQELTVESAFRNEAYIRQLKTRVKVLRNSWIREVIHSIENIDSPKNESFLRKFFTIQKNKKGKKFAEEISALQAPLFITRYALGMEHQLAILLDEEEFFLNNTQANQALKVGKLLEIVSEHKKEIDRLCGNRNTSKKAIESIKVFLDSLTDQIELVDVSPAEVEEKIAA